MSKLQKRLASELLGVGVNRIKLKNGREKEINEAITRNDVRGLIKKGIIYASKKQGISRARARKRHEQRLNGRRRGHGTWKGKKTARNKKKRNWINKIRPQRALLKQLRSNDSIKSNVYRKVYNLAKAGFFRSRNHLKLYINKLVKK